MNIPLYQIKHWNENFENSRTRKLKQMLWIPLKNKHDGDGYTELISTPNGVESLAAWVLMAQVASRCETRGLLQRDNGKPHTPETLARMTHTRPEIFSTAIPVLMQVQWLEQVGEIVQESDVDLHDETHTLQDSDQEGNGMEGNGREEPPTPKGVDSPQEIDPNSLSSIRPIARDFFTRYDPSQGITYITKEFKKVIDSQKITREELIELIQSKDWTEGETFGIIKHIKEKSQTSSTAADHSKPWTVEELIEADERRKSGNF